MSFGFEPTSPQQDIDVNPSVGDAELQHWIDTTRENAERAVLAARAADMAKHIADKASQMAISRAGIMALNGTASALPVAKSMMVPVAPDSTLVAFSLGAPAYSNVIALQRNVAGTGLALQTGSGGAANTELARKAAAARACAFLTSGLQTAHLQVA
eukprot:CAMPEP_0172821680 /NCGR_PEP_ID=MMETSP1075-20121228/16143_1 /TAXON_ID=2916 /ORGANISM="Ceratium fusus, Strain PA161109" /LENGTH=156 /DNA_ID=CAMNT_0013662571 /DNA_START=117 /DNA_END=584 /DNA_ORIENTATION=+